MHMSSNNKLPIFSCRMNLATFVTTYMEDDAEEVFRRTWNVNGADASQYPSCKTMEDR